MTVSTPGGTSTTQGARRPVPHTDLEVFPVTLGGNVFGWTADEEASFAVLDAYVAGGGNFIDTADVYSAWVPGHSGGESESVLGRWMAARGNRDDLVIATKVGSHAAVPGLSRSSIRTGVQASLQRLGTDRIDLYYAHRDDPDTPQEETVAAFGELVAEGAVRYVAASNYTPERLTSALRIADGLGVARFVALQPLYNLVNRDAYEGELASAVAAEGLGCVPYAALAGGFLTGKYRDGGAAVDSPRAANATKRLDDRGRAVLAALDEVSEQTGTSPTVVSLAWLAAQPTVVAPIASASRVEQVPDLLAGATLALTADQLALLDTASR
ncbi:aldo/keto reductase [Nakamurella endophytica]|uniref:NADP-dependent aryl-alcohol dehydrogenase n=1 Tax=Nakamurella endophytica TaxID=1748367 RepID=A0A917SY97_9ACTN|nr:aldo/keto reductase [Nakamurella endophytica]GGM00836.1 NADP-dependent aryl-alcohol dehydrogenase [Nakamurella endophytica]